MALSFTNVSTRRISARAPPVPSEALKGIAMIRLAGGGLRRAEIHWYEAHGVGRVRYKIKRFVD